MNHPLDQIREFRTAFGLITPETPSMPEFAIQAHYGRLFVEELGVEYMAAISEGNMLKVADSFVDGAVVLYHAVCGFGLHHHFQALFDEVNRSNLTKTPIGKENNSKFIKGPAFDPPSLAPILTADAPAPSSSPLKRDYDYAIMALREKEQMYDELRRALGVPYDDTHKEAVDRAGRLASKDYPGIELGSATVDLNTGEIT